MNRLQSLLRIAKLMPMLVAGLLLCLPLTAQPTEQSPVDISRSNTVRNPNRPQIDFNYGIAGVTLKNTYGSKDETGRTLAREWGTLKASIPDAQPVLWLNGVAYDLVQFHFHTPSEHTINGRHTEMEIHVVHLIHDNQGGAAACATSNRPLVVLGALIDPGSSDKELQRLFPAGLPRTNTDPPAEISNVDLRAALLPSGNPIWHYDGGLTAPANDCPAFEPLSTQAVTGNFPEAVHWYLYDKKLHLPQDLIDRFKSLFPDGNSRTVKALGDRKIYFFNRQNGDE